MPTSEIHSPNPTSAIVALPPVQRTAEPDRFIPEGETINNLPALFGRMVRTSSFVGGPHQPANPFLKPGTDINAFSAADGSICVTEGLIRAIHGDNGMLAFVLGHEMAHNQLQHHLRDVRRAVERHRLINYYDARCRAGENPSCIAGAAYAAASLIAEKKIQRDQENEADYMGMMAAAEAGYHPDYSILAARQLRASTGETSKFAAFFADHPRWTTREERAERHYQDAVARFNQFWKSAGDSPGGRPPAFAIVSGPKVQKNNNDILLHTAIDLHNLRYATTTATVFLSGESGAPQIAILQKELGPAPQPDDLVLGIARSSFGGKKGKWYVRLEIVSGPDSLFLSKPIKIN